MRELHFSDFYGEGYNFIVAVEKNVWSWFKGRTSSQGSIEREATIKRRMGASLGQSTAGTSKQIKFQFAKTHI